MFQQLEQGSTMPHMKLQMSTGITEIFKCPGKGFIFISVGHKFRFSLYLSD